MDHMLHIYKANTHLHILSCFSDMPLSRMTDASKASDKMVSVNNSTNYPDKRVSTHAAVDEHGLSIHEPVGHKEQHQ